METLKNRARRLKVKMRTRDTLRGSCDKPRICVFKSAKYTYVQVISDDKGATIVNASTRETEVAKAVTALEGSNSTSAKSISAAFKLGQVVGQKMKKANITAAVFDRNGFRFHGRMKAIAEGIRESGVHV